MNPRAFCHIHELIQELDAWIAHAAQTSAELHVLGSKQVALEQAERGLIVRQARDILRVAFPGSAESYAERVAADLPLGRHPPELTNETAEDARVRVLRAATGALVKPTPVYLGALRAGLLTLLDRVEEEMRKL